jgi:serine/threonine protein kinase
MHDKDPQAHKTLVVEFEIAPTTIVEEVFGSHLHGLRVYDAAASLQLFAHTENERIQWQERLHTAIQAMSKSVLHSPGASTADSTPKTCVAVREELSHKQLTRRLSSHRVMGREFVLEERYEFAKPIGQGAYGVVVSCVDKLTGKHVAVKKIAGVFEDIRDARKVLREIRLMRSLTHPNVLFLEDILDPLDHEFKDLYLITELMSTDLRKVIKRLSDSHQVLSENRQRFLMYQLLCGLEHLHLSGIIHRDIKPANILLSSSNISSGCVLKICDFGLARVQHTPSLNDFTRNMTEYVVTRWYR